MTSRTFFERYKMSTCVPPGKFEYHRLGEALVLSRTL